MAEDDECVTPELEMKLSSLDTYIMNFKTYSEAYNRKEIVTSMKQSYKQLKGKV
jgi:hypothetical protein